MSSVLLLKINSVGGKEVPALTVCNLLLSLTYYLSSLGSSRMETSAEPFPCFELNTTGDGLISLAGARPAAPPPAIPPQSQSIVPHPSLPVLGIAWLPGGATCHFNGIRVPMFIVRVALVGTAQHVEGRKRQNVCLSIYLSTRVVGCTSPPCPGFPPSSAPRWCHSRTSAVISFPGVHINIQHTCACFLNSD